MDKDTVIKVENLSKKFCRSLKRSMFYGTLDVAKNMLGIKVDTAKLRKEEFWALDNINFEVKRGESLGIIGQNGSGKSTLLRLLSGIYPPDKGKIAVKGRIGALIAVGAGFHPHMTGRENIFLNGTILGMSREEIKKKFNDIVEFANIGKFIDAPVATYSSGMTVRLGFSIAIYCEPEILLVDEILAVGDKDFQIKCYQKINEVKKRGTTIILVAHNEYAILENTKRCLYLEKGKELLYGNTEDVVNRYISDVLFHKSEIAEKDSFSEGEKLETKKIEDNNFSKKASIESLQFFDKNNQEVQRIASGDSLTIKVKLNIIAELHNPIVGVNFYDQKGFMFCANSEYEGIDIGDSFKPGITTVVINIPNFHLPTNHYVCSVIISEEMSSNLIDWKDMSYKLVVGRASGARGDIKIPMTWDVLKK